GDIAGDVRVVELPFNFYHDRSKGMKALKGMSSYFNQKISAAGFVNLGFYEIGQVYLVSSKKASSLSELQGLKIWSWEGDKIVEAMISSLKLVSVPLALPDVLSSLSTGIIDAAYAPPLGILALQWQSQVKYLVDFPTAYSIGALLISNKAWKKIKPDDQKIVRELAQKYVAQANDFAVEDNKKGLNALKEQGIEFIKFSEEDISKAEAIRSEVIGKLKGKEVSKEAIKKLETYR
ncbi:MAG: TRAP transporter substrate-binding protein DctP, partial [Bacteriovoracaceae bacterium]